MSLHLIMISPEFLLNSYFTLSELNDPFIIGEDVNEASAPCFGPVLSEETTSAWAVWVKKQHWAEQSGENVNTWNTTKGVIVFIYT